jgi:hypothetical protein
MPVAWSLSVSWGHTIATKCSLVKHLRAFGAAPADILGVPKDRRANGLEPCWAGSAAGFSTAAQLQISFHIVRLMTKAVPNL